MTGHSDAARTTAISRARVAEVIATGTRGERRGSGYRVSRASVLTAAHVIEGAAAVVVRFESDLPGEWSVVSVSWWADSGTDIGLITISAPSQDNAVEAVRFARFGDRAAVITVQAVGFPRWKLRNDDGTVPVEGDGRSRYRDAHHAVGSVAVLSNWREGTLEVVVAQPPAPGSTGGSPWEGMSGAALWADNRIVGVISAHHPGDGLARLSAARLDVALERLDDAQRSTLRSLVPLLTAGELTDVVPLVAEDRVLGAYQAQLLDTAPVELRDREPELAELVQFCAGDEPYSWWQAGPWAGKTALMSWFALHSPVGVDVVSFFVTSRFAGQSDSEAFTVAMLEQLAVLADEPPLSPTDGRARRGHLLRLLQAMSHKSSVAGRRLLVLVDGLDEDAYAGDGLRSSIAALLPRRLPPETRVLVTSRPSPGVPDDVPGDHPLRRVAPRPLAASKHARDVELAAKFELARLLGGSEFQRDVLGFITASGGGISAADLEHLTGRPRYEVNRLLSGHFGRSTSTRMRRGSADDASVIRSTEPTYGLSHATLRQLAQEQFGRSLANYRERLHSWAEEYRAQSWPVSTPDYLLRGYPQMLTEHEDVARLTALVVDRARHDRMLDATGGDAAALAEVSVATTAASAQPIPDLTALLLLAVTREDLGGRNAGLPPELAALWVAAGFPDRAVALANGIADLRARARAATLMIPAAAVAGDQGLARRCETIAERSIRAIPQFAWRAPALARLVRALATTGRHRRALDLVYEIPEPALVAEALSALLPALVAVGDHERADAVVIEAERRAARLADAAARAEALAGLARTLDAAGYRDKARALLRRARRTVRDIEEPGRRAQAVCQLVDATAAVGDLARAEELSRQIEDVGWQDQAIAGLIGCAAAAGDRGRAWRLVGEIGDAGWQQEAKAALIAVDKADSHSLGEITDVRWRAQAMLGVMRARADAGDRVAAAAMAETVERLARATPDTNSRAEALAGLAVLMGSLGENVAVERALLLTREIPNPASRLQALTGLAEQLVASGDLDQVAAIAREAEQLARRAPDLWRTQATIRLVATLAEIGETARAIHLVAFAERSVAGFRDPSWRAKAWTELIVPVATAGDPARALRIATTAEETARGTLNQVQALTQLVAPIAAAGDPHRARQLAADIERLALDIPNDSWQAQALAQLADALMAVGDVDQALRVAKRISVDEWRAKVLCEGALRLTRERRDAPADDAQDHETVIRRMAADILCTPLWTQALPIVGQLDPAALYQLSAALCEK